MCVIKLNIYMHVCVYNTYYLKNFPFLNFMEQNIYIFVVCVGQQQLCI